MSLKIADALDDIEGLQHHQRVKEQNHRDQIDTTNARVSWLSFIESVVLIGITLAQLHYVRSWFNEAQSKNRV